MRAPAVVLLLLLAATLVQPAAAQSPRELVWEYRVRVSDPASGALDVELRFHDLEGIVTRMTLLTMDHRYPILDIRGGPSTPLETAGGGVSFRVDDDLETVRFRVDVVREAFREGQRLSHLDDEFGLLKAEAFALAFTYQYYEDRAFRWSGRVAFEELPDGWHSAAPWNRTAPHEYALPPGQVLPRGFVALGPFETPPPVEVGGKLLTHVRLGKAAPYERDLESYLSRATPYYRAVYGPGPGDHLLVVSAPDPMFRGGLGGTDSVFLHETSDLRTLAHEYAHVFQLFATVESAGSSAIWLNEGDADLHSALSLFAAGFWTPEDVNAFLRDIERESQGTAYDDARLPDATYGTSLERFAYHKGVAVLRALDQLLRDLNDNGTGVAELMRQVNALHGPHAEGGRAPLDNARILEVASELAGHDLTDFFERYVLGTEWPSFIPFVPEGDVIVSELRLEPSRAAPGEPVLASLRVHNGGTGPVSHTLGLTLSGTEVAQETLRLDVGDTKDVSFVFLAPESGDHEVRVGYLRAIFHSLEPPRMHLGNISTVPASVYAGEDVHLLVAIENGGERAGTGRALVFADGEQIAKSTEVFVDGGGAESTAIPLRFDQPGSLQLVVRLDSNRGSGERIVGLVVRPADADRDGVPDAEDGYPNNAALARQGVLNDVRDAVPLPVWMPLAAIAIAFLARRR